MKIHILAATLLVGSFASGLAQPAAAATEIEKSYRFELDEWHEIDLEDGPVTVYRMQLERKQGRVTKAKLIRPHNTEYLDTLRVQIEYTNEASKDWKARVNLRWLDEDDEVIDGFSANEELDSKTARGIVNFSVPTFKYGLERAKTLEVTLHIRP